MNSGNINALQYHLCEFIQAEMTIERGVMRNKDNNTRIVLKITKLDTFISLQVFVCL
jgi:hypothetical protein